MGRRVQVGETITLTNPIHIEQHPTQTLGEWLVQREAVKTELANYQSPFVSEPAVKLRDKLVNLEGVDMGSYKDTYTTLDDVNGVNDIRASGLELLDGQ